MEIICPITSIFLCIEECLRRDACICEAAFLEGKPLPKGVYAPNVWYKRLIRVALIAKPFKKVA